jgi:hypothetical protein
MNRLLPLLSILILPLLLLPACTSHLQQKENFLREAGFLAVKPTTPSQIAKVQALTPGKITQMTRKGHTLFVYSDPHKNLLLVGANPQFERYQHILYSKVVIPDRAADKEDKLLADDYAGWGGMMDPFFGPMFY